MCRSALFTLLTFPVLLGAQATQGARPWSAQIAANNYFFPDAYIFSPVVSADHDWLHLESRYNYEDLQTLSLFGGYNFRIGDAPEFAATPMLGMAFGNRTAIIPALELTLSHGRFELYTESEFLIDYSDSEFNFLYAWTEFNYYPLDWLSVGILATRTRLFENDLDIQRGISAGWHSGHLSVSGAYMNIGYAEQYIYLSAVFRTD